MANGKMIQPTPNDVLSGRGASFNRHPGNENFRQMLEQHRVRSSKVPRSSSRQQVSSHIYLLSFIPSPQIDDHAIV